MLYGALFGACRALNGGKRRFPARAVTGPGAELVTDIKAVGLRFKQVALELGLDTSWDTHTLGEGSKTMQETSPRR